MTTLQRHRHVNHLKNLHQLEVKSISGSEWLVYDQGEHVRTGIGIVGFIEEVDGGFQVLAFSALSQRMQFETFELALAFVAARCPRPPDEFTQLPQGAIPN